MRPIPPLLVVAAALAACGGGNDAPPPAASGAVGVATPAGATKLYLRPRASGTSAHARLAAVDAAAASGTSGLVTFVDLGQDGVVWAVGADGADVVAADRTTPTVYFVDAATDTLRGTAPLPAGAEPVYGSQNGSTYGTGVAVDAARRRAYVGTSLGIVEYDLDSRAEVATYAAKPSENFALDRGTGRIYAPFYLCDPTFPEGPDLCSAFVQPGGPPLTDSVTVLDTRAGRRWELVDEAAAEPWAPLGKEPDATALDTGLGLAVVAVEHPTGIHLLPLGAGTFDDGTSTFQVPPASRPVLTMPADQYTAVAVDQATHLLVAAQEQSNGLYFLDLARALRGEIVGLAVTMPDTPDAAMWFNHGDPHGVTIAVVAGRPQALVYNDDRTWVARIDLLAVQAMLGGGGTFADHVAFVGVPAPP